MSIEDRWIPTTTCMWPKKKGKYLITVKVNYTESGYSVEEAMFDPNHNDKPAWYQGQMNEYLEFDTEFFASEVVTAWMPFPKPYTKGV